MIPELEAKEIDSTTMALVTSNPVVRVVPFQPHCFAFGGFEIQMISAMDAARASGIDVEPLNFWAREANFDIVHLWGWGLEHRMTAEWAHLGGKKVVLSALVKYPGWITRLRYMASYVLGPARIHRPMFSNLDAITVVNEEQKKYLVSIVGFPEHKVVVIPNIVEDIFFDDSSQPAVFDPGIKDYVLCTGNVCPRKNQLLLIKACQTIGVPLLIVGHLLTGQDEYGRAVESAIQGDKGTIWIKGLAPGSKEMVSAYRHASVFSLVSLKEEQPISALEAAASRKPLVLGNFPYARQRYFERAAVADPHSIDSIAAAIRRALNHPTEHSTPLEIIESCRRSAVGAAYARTYRNLLAEE